MATNARPPARGLLSVAAALLAVAIGIQVVRDRGWRPYQPPNPLLWVQSGPLMSRLALGFNNVVADVYWMRAVVYYGGKLGAEGQQRNFDLLYPLLDLVTSLDPHFKVAYRFGAIFLTEAFPSGPGRPDLAVKLLETGIARDSARWEYFQDIGFVYYWWLRDFTTAAEWFRKGSQQPGAPAWLALVAANTLTEGGDRQSSRFLWQQLRDGTDIAWVRRSATLRLQQLDAMDIIDEVNRLADQFRTRVGRPAAGWPELVKAERLRGVPLDPAGVPLAYNPNTGRADVDRRSPLWPLPTSMPHAQAAK